MQELRRRSLVKGISWRAFATLDTILLALIFTGSAAAALSIGALELLTKTLWYYAHERAWLRVAPDPESPLANYFGHAASVRAIVKAATWRALGALDTFALALIVTGHLGVSGAIGGTELITKIGLYYLHERLWLHVRWARIEQEAASYEDSFAGRLREALDIVKGHLHTGLAILYALLCFVFVCTMALLVYALHSA